MLIVSHVAVSSPGAEGAAGSAERVQPTFRCHEGIFTVDVEADPARIDIEFVEGPEAGNWSYGIYSLDGDALVVCLGLTGAQRPQRFGTAAGSRHALERRDHLVRICMAPPDRPRPGDFSSEKGSGHIFSEWKRSSS